MKRSAWPQILLILIAVFAVFGQCMTFEFVRWDDDPLIVENPYVNPPSAAQMLAAWHGPHASLYIPLTYNAWAALAAVAATPGAPPAEINPYVFHAANVLVHAASALLVFGILRLILGTPWIAAAGALLFALHPLQVEPIAWATGMKDLLSGMLALLAVYLYVMAAKEHGSAKSGRRLMLLYVAATVSLLLGSFAKPGIVGVPLFCIALDWLMIGRPLKRAILCAIPLIIAVIPTVIVTQLAQPASAMELAPVWSRPLIAGHALSVYLQKLVWPNVFAMDEGYPPGRVMQGWWVYAAWLVPAGVTLAALIYRAGRRPLLAGWIIFLAGVAPIMGLTPFIFQYISTVADRYVYLSMLGAALAGGWLLTRLRPRTAAAVAFVVVGALGIRSYVQASTWADSRTLFEHTVRVNPQSYLAHNTLASILAEEASALRAGARTPAQMIAADELLKLAEAHVDKSLAVWPGYYMALKNRALLQMARGDVDAALRTMQESVEAYDRFPEALKGSYTDHLAVARAAMKHGRREIAAGNAQLHLQRHPDSAEARDLLEQATSTAPATTQAKNGR